MTDGQWVTVRYAARKHRLLTHGDDDVVNRSYQRGHFYEVDLLEAIAQQQRSGLYLDVGAHIGNHSLFFATECRSARVIGFEPWPASYQLALRTMQANGVAGKVTLVNQPVSDKHGTGVSYVPPASVTNTGAGRTVKGGTVKSVSIDAAVSRLAPGEAVAVVKIDVEGFGEKWGQIYYCPV